MTLVDQQGGGGVKGRLRPRGHELSLKGFNTCVVSRRGSVLVPGCLTDGTPEVAGKDGGSESSHRLVDMVHREPKDEGLYIR